MNFHLAVISPVLLLASFPMVAAADEKGVDTSVFANQRLASLVQGLESKADRFEAHASATLKQSRWSGTEAGGWLEMSIEDLEDELDDMAEDFSEKDPAEFNAHLENSLLLATAVNRALLQGGMQSVADTDWKLIRQDLNAVARLLKRPVLPNLTVATFTPAPAAILSRADVRQVMDELESSTDRFKEKFDSAWHTSISSREQARLFKRWAEALEDTSDQMLDAYKSRDTRKTQEKLELTLLIASGVNRMMLDSKTSPIPLAEWGRVRGSLNTLAQAFVYPVLPDTIVDAVRIGTAH